MAFNNNRLLHEIAWAATEYRNHGGIDAAEVIDLHRRISSEISEIYGTAPVPQKVAMAEVLLEHLLLRAAIALAVESS